MLRALAFALALLGLGLPGVAVADSGLCHKAAERAARIHGVPLAILTAISEVETGRTGPSGVQPWPWALNHAGTGRWYATRAEAVAALGSLLARGDRRVDAGCFQINHRAHGHAFASAQEMLDPVANADYAARFLRSLHAESGSWTTAVGHYHSRTPRLARAYRGRVLGRTALPDSDPASMPVPSRTGSAAQARHARLARLYARFRRQTRLR